MEPRAPTPKEAQRWLLIYNFFNTHEKATFESWSSIDFENDLKVLGQEVWRTEDIFEIVEHLKEIAKAGKVVDQEKALVPLNIDALVSEHLAAQQKGVQKPKPGADRPTQRIGEWIKEYRLNEIRNALQTVVGKENAQGIAPLFESRLMEIATKMEMATKEEIFTEDQLRELVSSTLLEAAPQIANRETAEEVATSIANTSLVRKILPKGIEAIGDIRPVKVPQPKTAPEEETITTDSARRTLREAQLLLRVSYLRPSVVKQFFAQIGTLSLFRLFHALGGTNYANSHPLEAGVQSLLLKGVTITLLRQAITSLKEQNPEIAPNDPRLRTFEEIITAMETYKSSHPGNYEKFERRAAVSVEIATSGEEVPATPGKMLRLRSVFDQAGKFQFLRIDTLSLKKGIRSLPGIVGRTVSYPFLYAARIFFGKPAGGILHALGGPRAVAVREVSFGVQKGLVNFAKGAFRQLGSFASDVFTRPALGWLRWGLAGGFGLGAFTLPFPFNFISGGASGGLLVAQGAHSTQGFGSAVGGLGRRLSFVRPLSATGGLSGFRWIAIFVAPIILIFILAPLFNVNTAQSTFLGVGGTGTAGFITRTTACFTFSGWTDKNEVELMTQAISFIAKSPTYMSKLCSPGNIKRNIEIQRSYSETTTKTVNGQDEIVPITWGGYVPDSNTIIIYRLGVGNLEDAIYTLAHETGHVYDGRIDNAFTDFMAEVNPPTDEPYLETYAFGKKPAEDLAETFGLYVVWNRKTFAGGKINMPEQYSKHYIFAKKIFGGVEYKNIN